MIGSSADIQGIVPRLGAAAARLAPLRRLYFETANGVELASGGRGRRYWIISRGMCRFFSVPVSADATRSRQLEAIGLEIRRLSPFAETGSHFHLGPSSAGLWLWDERATRETAAAFGVDVSSLRVLPEPALLPPAPDGTRLIKTLDGFEGQYWKEGSLRASRWWPEAPDQREWILFQHGASAEPDELQSMAPTPLRLTWLDRPWTRARRSGAFDLPRIDLRLVAAGVAAAFLIAYALQGAAYLHMRKNLAALARDIEAREAAIEPALAARTRALDNLSAIRTLYELDPTPGQLTLMARVAEILPGRSRLDDWVYDRGQLELSIASDQPIDVVGLVRELEGSGYFTGVATERVATNNTLRLHAGVVAR